MIFNEDELRRFLETELARPGLLPPAPRPIALIKEGVPSDADFPGPPSDGIFAYDKSTGTLYARVNDEWQAV